MEDSFDKDQLYDVIIIGAGPAGFIASYESLILGKKVLVIDEGESGRQNYASSLYDSRFANSSTGGIGGAARIWGAQSGFLDTTSLNKWQIISNFGENEVAQLFESMHRVNKILNIQIAPDNYYPIKSEKFLKNTASKFGVDLRHTNFPKDHNIENHWKKILKNQNLKVILGESLRNITASGFSNYDLNFSSGKVLKSNGAIVIISAGTVSTTEIILRSFPDLSEHFKVGESLIDHPCGVVATFKANGNKQFLKGQIRRTRYGTLKRKYQYRQNNEIGIAELQYSLVGKANCILTLLRANINRISIRLLKRFILRPLNFDVWIQIEQSSSNQLKLNKEGILESNWMYSDVDREHVKRIYAAMKNMLTSEGFNIENEANLDELDFSQAFHPSSTIKMHKDPGHGVVNCFGIMHSHPRILIASAAVFPKPGWVNPSFLIMCLSSMGVRKILENA